MAKKEGYVIDLSLLRRKKNNASASPSDLLFKENDNKNTAYMAFANGKKVYNKAWYYLYVNNDDEVIVSADGSAVSVDEIESYKTDYDGVKTNIGVSGNTIQLSPNTTENEKTGSYSIVQDNSYFSISGTYRQLADEFIGYEYRNLAITSVYYLDISVTGGYSEIQIEYSYDRRELRSSGVHGSWDNGRKETTTSFTDITGKSLVSNATFNSSNGEVYADNLYKTERPITNVAQVTYVKIYMYGMEDDWSGVAYCEQEENRRDPYTTSYSVTAVADNDEPLAVDETVRIDISAYRTDVYIYSTGEFDYEDPVAETATVTTTAGSVSPTSVTGSGYVTLTMGENQTESERQFIVTASAGTAKDQATITQQAVLIETEEWEAPVGVSLSFYDIAANGDATTIYIYYTQNYVRYVNGKREILDTEEGRIPVSYIKGDGSGSVSGSGIGADTLGTDVTKERTLRYTISEVGLTNHDVSNTYKPTSSEKNVYQEINSRHPQDTVYHISLSPSTGSIANTGGSVSFTVTAKKTTYYVFTSGAEDYEDTFGTATLSNSGSGTLSSTSVAHGGTASVSFTENEYMVTRTASITASWEGAKGYGTYTQNAASFELYAACSTVEIDSAGGVFSAIFVSKRNGKAYALSTSDISSTLSGVSVTRVSATGGDVGEYEAVLNAPANDSGERTFFVIATQGTSGYTASVQATQYAYVPPVIYGKVLVNAVIDMAQDLSYVSYSVSFTANVPYYTGGTLSNVIVSLNTSSSGGSGQISSKTLASSLTVANGTTSSTYTGTLNNPNKLEDIYFLVEFDGEIQYYEQPPILQE